MSLTLYIDLYSQPARAVKIFCQLAQIQHQTENISIMMGQNSKQDYLKINPTGKVPAIKDGDYVLFESNAILRYLARSRNVDDHFYPKDPIKASKVDMYLDWHHLNIRQFASSLVYFTLFRPDVDINRADLHKNLLKAIENFELIFLQDGWSYINNMTQYSIADIQAYCEFVQLELLNIDYKKHKNIVSWMKKLHQIKQLQDVNSQIFELIKKNNKSKF